MTSSSTANTTPFAASSHSHKMSSTKQRMSCAKIPEGKANVRIRNDRVQIHQFPSHNGHNPHHRFPRTTLPLQYNNQYQSQWSIPPQFQNPPHSAESVYIHPSPLLFATGMMMFDQATNNFFEVEKAILQSDSAPEDHSSTDGPPKKRLRLDSGMMIPMGAPQSLTTLQQYSVGPAFHSAPTIQFPGNSVIHFNSAPAQPFIPSVFDNPQIPTPPLSPSLGPSQIDKKEVFNSLSDKERVEQKIPMKKRSSKRKKRKGRTVVLENGMKTGTWTQDEHKRFLEAIELYSRGRWREIARHVQTRTRVQCASHSQKYILSLERDKDDQEDENK